MVNVETGILQRKNERRKGEGRKGSFLFGVFISTDGAIYPFVLRTTCVKTPTITVTISFDAAAWIPLLTSLHVPTRQSKDLAAGSQTMSHKSATWKAPPEHPLIDLL